MGQLLRQICADNRTKVQLTASRDTTYMANRQMPRIRGPFNILIKIALEGTHTMNQLTEANCDLNVIDSSNPMRHASEGVAARASLAPMGRRKAMVALILAISFCVGSVRLTAAQNVPSGTIELTGGSVAAGIGYTWAKGVLIFGGKQYPLTVSGLSIVHVGISHYTASGTVYDLNQVSDINGIYTAVSAGAAIAGGASVTAMKNSRGVLIQMVATHAGLNFSLGPKGMTVSLR
jgi:hypothetical protein